jgi:ABC-type Fe3+-hydroxamate transport system substrate-binding protein
MTVKSSLDQLGTEVSFHFPPDRIISLVPSQTELLADLKLDQQVVGITKYCVHPSAWSGTKTIVGGTKNFDFDVIDQLCPDVIIANKEENYQSGIERLKQKYPVWISDVANLDDAHAMITSVGSLTGTDARAQQINQNISDQFRRVEKKSNQSVLYLIWRKPWMGAGQGTFIDAMLRILNLRNVIEASRYPELTPEHLRSLKPDFIFLSSEPYPFREKHLHELSEISPSSKVVLVDGEMFSWYGSRLIYAPDYFNLLKLD